MKDNEKCDCQECAKKCKHCDYFTYYDFCNAHEIKAYRNDPICYKFIERN